MGNSAIIEKLLAKTRIVTIDGMDLELSVPSAATLAGIQKAALSHAENPDTETALESVTGAVAATLGCDDEDAARVLVMAGGMGGELAKAALEMCGLTVPEGEEDVDGDFLPSGPSDIRD